MLAFILLVKIIGPLICGCICGFTGMIAASIFDRGTRYSGNIYGDIPSSLGSVIGFMAGVYMAIN